MFPLCIWFKEEPSQFSMGQTAQSLTCFIMENHDTGLDKCLRILLSCFRARNSDRQGSRKNKRPCENGIGASRTEGWSRSRSQCPILTSIPYEKTRIGFLIMHTPYFGNIFRHMNKPTVSKGKERTQDIN